MSRYTLSINQSAQRQSVLSRAAIISPVLFSLLLAACGGDDSKKQAGPPPPTPVNTIVVTKGDAAYYDEYPSTITAINQVEIRPQVSGYVSGIHFREGQKVSKGQLLYTISPEQYQAQYNQAVANLNANKATLEKAQQDADRYRELLSKDAIAKQVVDHALADLETAKRQVDAAKAGVSNVQTILNYASIHAPMAGTIGISLVKPGAAVTPGTTLLNTISTDDPMGVDINISEKEVGRFVALQNAKLPAGDTTISLVLPDGSIYDAHGSIYAIDRAIDPTTSTMKVRFSFTNKDGRLKPGMTGNIHIMNDAAKQMVMIPYKAVTEQMGEYFVFTVQGGRAIQHKLSLGARLQDKVVVNSGINEGDSLVTDGMQKLRDSSAVQTGAPAPAAAPAK